MELLSKGQKRVCHATKSSQVQVVGDFDLVNKKVVRTSEWLNKYLENDAKLSAKKKQVRKLQTVVVSGSLRNKYIIPRKPKDPTRPVLKSYSGRDHTEILRCLSLHFGKLEVRNIYILRRRTELNELNERVIAKRKYKASKECYEHYYGSINKSKKGKYDENGVSDLLHMDYLPGRNSFRRKLDKIVKSEFGDKKKGASSADPRPDRCQLKIHLGHEDTQLNWETLLSALDNQSIENLPSVPSFKNAPFGDIWNELAIPGLAIEIRNPFATEHGPDVYWIATIQKFAGYYCMIQFETFQDTTLKKFPPTGILWVNFCSSRLKPLGWSTRKGRKLHPGKLANHKPISDRMIQEKLKEYKGKPSLPWDYMKRFQNKIFEIEAPWNRGGLSLYEAIDINSLHQNRICRVHKVVGNRVQINFGDVQGCGDPTTSVSVAVGSAPGPDTATADSQNPWEAYKNGFWLDCKSEYLHDFMWSHSVGVKLNGIQDDFRGLYMRQSDFPPWPRDTMSIEEGMMLETRHPYFVHKIVLAVIIKVLNYGYFMIETRDFDLMSRGRFVHHVTGPYVLPLGWGQAHDVYVEGIVENGDNQNIQGTGNGGNNLRLELDLLPPRPPHNFVVGNQVEVIEIQNSEFLGPATVEKVAGHLLLLKFNSWGGEGGNACQWVDPLTSEIYPMGYSEILLERNWNGTHRKVKVIPVTGAA